MAEAAPAQRVATQESLLLDYVHRLDSHKQGRRAVHVHLSALQAYNRREHHIRIAANTFEPLVKMHEGQLFVLKNSDLFFIYKAGSQSDVETSLLKLRFLFSDDPLMGDEVQAAGDNNAFHTYYDAEKDYPKILAIARAMVHAGEDESPAQQTGNAKNLLQKRQEKGEPLNPRLLGRVIQSLQRADLSNMVRRQFICALIGKATPQPLFSELFISIADLRETLMPGVNVSASKWLFQHLTETLDRRVLAMLSKTNDHSITGEISVNLNVSTLLSPEFIQFDDSLNAAMRGSVVVELQKVDIFSDLNAFLFARDFAKERGYRICIDGLTYETMPFVNREKLGADMVKLVWQTDLEEKVGPKRIRRLVKDMQAARVILCRCDNEAAVTFGQGVGINMFQGRYIENLIAEEARRREIEMARRRTSQPLEPDEE
jgi:EAL domain-containing protein (putative c-di-GMP-specific phosphodiesterase class I)